MKVVILNSGLGKRMGTITSDHPKCMTLISDNETIISRQLKQIAGAGITEVIITTGYCEDVLINYCCSLDLPLKYSFIKNDRYTETNYIYSIYKAREYFANDDILLMHGDMVFESSVLDEMISRDVSCMAVSKCTPLPEKDFKAIISGDKIEKIGIEFFNNAVTAQPFYFIKQSDWNVWLHEIVVFCENGNVSCYAENAFNRISDKCNLRAYDIGDMLCNEIDTPEDLTYVTRKINELDNRTVYMCFSTDVIHSGHIEIIRKASRLGKLIVGVLSDEAVVSYKRFPLLPCEERMKLFENIKGVKKVVKQNTLSYAEILRSLKPYYVVHGDDWKKGVQKFVRDEVVDVLASYGGRLIEFPYERNSNYNKYDRLAEKKLSLPDMRRGRLKELIRLKGCVNAIEAHSGLTGLIAEKTLIEDKDGVRQFDAMWISSLCDSTAKGKPDIELVDMTSRFRTIDDIMEVTTKPIIFDGDTGGLIEHFIYTVKSLERMGVSMVIVEDKCGLKKNSLFGNEVEQTQETIENFCNKISAGKKAQKTSEFMIVSRIESLILEKGMDDALARAFAYVNAGTDGIMIHSRKKDPSEIFEFISKFREKEQQIPIIVVPTSFNEITEDEFKERGVNVIIYANQLTRSAYPAMVNVAETILRTKRAKDTEELCMPFKDIIRLIPEEY